MRVEKFMEAIGADFYAGVPDSQLRVLCDALMRRWGIDPTHHVIAANEGNAAALAAGYHLATGKVPVVYMQNSGEGNIINPLASLLDRAVYAIPTVFIIGWRGEPGVHDEPQHVYQGEVTLELLRVMRVAHFVLRPEASEEELAEAMEGFRTRLAQGECVAFVVAKGALTGEKTAYSNRGSICREEAISLIAEAAGESPIVSTTGKASRELFEIREARGQGHHRDFLTVGSMGHASSIALGIACQKPDTKVWCIDGDGAALMHLGAMAVIGSQKPGNLVHIVINNEAHETVGGMPTVAGKISLTDIARACGYPKVSSADSLASLREALAEAAEARETCFIEVKCALGARADLGRPTTTPQENKTTFMTFLRNRG
ncbi:MAG: phosphonopyruvate decarboxylase [Clostridia bacterium]|nr:phosphonopyruvate decarboxylase [Clostridia bacterium]